MRLDDKHILITGGGRGLGFAFAQAVLAAGGTVSITGRDGDKLRKAAEALSTDAAEVSVHTGDVRRADDVSRAIDSILERFGRIDGVVNNAGIADEAGFLDITEAGWREVIEVNLTGPFLVTQAAARVMPAGSIVNIASVDAWGADGPYASYVAAKHGLVGLTRAAAAELGCRGIRVNSVSPGWTMTDMVAESVSATVLARMETAFSRAAIGRVVDTTEVAAAVTFLLSDVSSGITGIDIPVDGGTLANLYILETLADGA